MEAKITNYGGILVSLKTPDRYGNLADIVLGCDSLDGYIANRDTCLGGITGRYANRIAGARFTLNGVEYRVTQNHGRHSLHGGRRGFDRRVWTPQFIADNQLRLTYLSRDGEEGYPGNLITTVTYSLSDAELTIDYAASTDRDTVLNLTNHIYLNLKGAGCGTILHHRLTLLADLFAPVDAELIPTGELRPVAGSAFDFRESQPIGAMLQHADEQLTRGQGFDHTWLLTGAASAARIEEPTSGRIVEIRTSEPGIHLYTGNFLNGSAAGKGGHKYEHRAGLCLEPQHFADSPNRQQFPSTVLEAGVEFRSTTSYRFTKV